VLVAPVIKVPPTVVLELFLYHCEVKPLPEIAILILDPAVPKHTLSVTEVNLFSPTIGLSTQLELAPDNAKLFNVPVNVPAVVLSIKEVTEELVPAGMP
jgi:hypothetical protein